MNGKGCARKHLSRLWIEGPAKTTTSIMAWKRQNTDPDRHKRVSLWAHVQPSDGPTVQQLNKFRLVIRWLWGGKAAGTWSYSSTRILHFHGIQSNTFTFSHYLLLHVRTAWAPALRQVGLKLTKASAERMKAEPQSKNTNIKRNKTKVLKERSMKHFCSCFLFLLSVFSLSSLRMFVLSVSTATCPPTYTLYYCLHLVSQIK
jgi:hypothetical protein